MRPALVLGSSLCLNVALALTAAHVLRKPAPQVPRVAALPSQAQTTDVRVVTNLPPPTKFVTNHFHWRQLESTNYDEFVANLRRVGCPERTIRDVILADVWRTYTAKMHQRPRLPFWSNGPRRARVERQHESELVRLQDGLAAAVRRLFGLEWSPQWKRDPLEEDQAGCRLFLGEVSEEQFQRAYGLIMAASQAKEDAAWRCRGVFLAEDYASLMQRRDELEGQLRGVLSPVQFEEFTARVGLLEWLFHSDGLEQLKPAPAQLREISLAGSQIRPLGWKFLDLEESESEEEKEKGEAALQHRLRKILGDARYAEYELLQDHRYRSIHAFADEAQLPLETAHKLYEVQKLAASEVQSLRQDKTLDATIRTQRLDAVTASVSREISALLGPKRFGEFLRQSGQWVTNANRL